MSPKSLANGIDSSPPTFPQAQKKWISLIILSFVYSLISRWVTMDNKSYTAVEMEERKSPRTFFGVFVINLPQAMCFHTVLLELDHLSSWEIESKIIFSG